MKVGSIPAGAILFIAVTSLGAGAGFAQTSLTPQTAQTASPQAASPPDSCLKAPKGPAPAGSRWYYRTDPATKSKCWSIKPVGQTAQQVTQPAPFRLQSAPATGQLSPATPSAAAPAPTVSGLSGLQSPAWPAPGQQSQQQPGASTVAWPAPPPPPASTDTVTPENILPASPDQSAPPQAAAVQSTQPNAPLNLTPTNSPQETAQDKPVVQSSTEPVTPAPSMQTRLPLALLLAGVFGLLAIGMLLRRVVARAFGRRREIKASRREPRLSGVAKQTPPTLLRHSPSLVPGQAETEHRVSEIEDALRHLAQRLRRRSAPLGNVPNVPRSGVRARS
jgi:hypothetical protein